MSESRVTQQVDTDDRNRRNRRTAGRLALVTLAMFGFGFALVPLYDILCEITGLNGKTGRVEAAVVTDQVDTSRTIKVEFISSVSGGLEWKVRPKVTSMEVHPGKIYETAYVARSTSRIATVGQAVPSVAPNRASMHFNKTECFCFTQQQFEAGEGREMPVRFIIASDIPTHIKTVTLSYTFYDVGNGSG